MSWDAARAKRHPYKTNVSRAMKYLRRCKETPNGCLVFQANPTCKRSGHYSQVIMGKRWSLHRFIYSMLVAPVPQHLKVCHTCDNGMCMNIDHLWLGTQRENSLDMVSKGRQAFMKKTHCKNGHEFTPDNVYRTKSGWRQCKKCHQVRYRVASGWTKDEAESTPKIPPNARTARRTFGRMQPPNC